MSNITSSLTEGQFLMEFGAAIVVVIGLMALWREWLLGRHVRGDEPAVSLDRYEFAWLKDGRRGAIQLAIRNLIRNGELAPDLEEPSMLHATGWLTPAHPFEAHIYHAVAQQGQMGLDEIYRATAKHPAPARLVTERLIQSPVGRSMAMVPALFVIPALLFVGSCEAVHLLTAGLPVTPLVLLTVGGSLLSAMLCIPSLRTRRGEAELLHLQQTPIKIALPAQWVSRPTAKAA